MAAPLPEQIPAELEHAVSLAKFAAWLITGLIGIIGTIGGYLWVRLNSDVTTLSTREDNRIKDLYQHLENVRKDRDTQVNAIDRRLSTLEGEHKGCNDRLKRLEELDD